MKVNDLLNAEDQTEMSKIDGTVMTKGEAAARIEFFGAIDAG